MYQVEIELEPPLAKNEVVEVWCEEVVTDWFNHSYLKTGWQKAKVDRVSENAVVVQRLDEHGNLKHESYIVPIERRYLKRNLND